MINMWISEDLRIFRIPENLQDFADSRIVRIPEDSEDVEDF